MKNEKKVGRPTLPKNKKKKNRVSIYISDDDLVKLENMRSSFNLYYPPLSLNDFFILLLNNYDETLIPYLLESKNSEVKQYMNKLITSKSLFVKDFKV